ERSVAKGDDPHVHARIIQIISKQGQLLIGVTPPTFDLGKSQPPSLQREIVSIDRSERVVRHDCDHYRAVPQSDILRCAVGIKFPTKGLGVHWGAKSCGI